MLVCHAAADNEGEVTYSATIPGDKVAAGTMIRWRVQVSSPFSVAEQHTGATAVQSLQGP